jgi:Amt family ammonium transporter
VHLVGPAGAVLIGAVGGVVSVLAAHLLERLRIDDAVGAVPVHLAAGIWGTLAVALVGDPAGFPAGGGRLDQLGIQALGVGAAGAVAFGLGYPGLWLLNRWLPLRVDAETERIGLNVGEHGASSALYTLLEEMDAQRRHGDFTRPVQVEETSEAGLIAAQYNQVLRRVRAESDKRERAHRELAAAKDAAERADRAKSHFLASMSHELRTPLNAVLGFSEIMRNETFGPLGSPRYGDYVQDIHGSASHLLSLINDLLDLSKIEADKYELTESELDGVHLVRRCARLTAGLTDKRRQRLALDLPDAPLGLRADERVLRQMLLNLISNAAKYSPEGGEIRVGLQVEVDGRVALYVADTGPGMSRQEVRRALEPFGQAGQPEDVTVAEKNRGTGLGLPLTRKLMELHGGSLVIDSTKGRGTTVVLRFPAARRLDPLPEARPAEA